MYTKNSVSLLYLSESPIPFTGVIFLFIQIFISTVDNLILANVSSLSHVPCTQKLEYLLHKKIKNDTSDKILRHKDNMQWLKK